MAMFYPVIQFFDDNGNVLANGKVYTYVAGTTTPKSAYTNQGGGTTLENPILLDSAGRPQTSGSIWLSGAYTLRIVDSEGNTVGNSVETLNGYNPVDFSTLTATIDQLNHLQIPPGTAGQVIPNTLSVADTSKSIATYGQFTAATLSATTGIIPKLFKDANGVTAIRIDDTVSQVNQLTLTPTATGSSPTLASTGTDTNVAFKLASKGTGFIKINSFKFPSTDGSTNYQFKTNGAGTWTFGRSDLYYQKGTIVDGTLVGPTSIGSYTNNTPYPPTSYLSSGLSITITPSSATSLLIMQASIITTTQVNNATVLFIDNGVNVIAGTANYALVAGAGSNVLRHVMVAGSTAARTYTVRLAASSTNVRTNNTGFTTGQLFTTAIASSSFTIMEILQ